MASITDEIRAKAEFYKGDEKCQEKVKEFLEEVGLPNGLLPLKDIIEVGYERESGFVWLKQKTKIEHKFEQIGKLVSYGTEVTATVEPKKIKKLTGVKAKEFLIWLTLCDIYLDEPPTGKIHFQTPSGLSRTFPVSAFEVPEVEKKVVTNGAEVAETEKKVVINGAEVAETEKKVETNGAVSVASAQEVKQG